MEFYLSCTVSGKLFDLYILGTATGCTLSARKQLFLKCSCTSSSVFDIWLWSAISKTFSLINYVFLWMYKWWYHLETETLYWCESWYSEYYLNWQINNVKWIQILLFVMEIKCVVTSMKICVDKEYTSKYVIR